MDRTRRLLQDALVDLIREQPYQDIEIQAITERANTARVTFYRHYGSKDELLLDYLERLYHDMKETMESFCFDRLFDQQNPPTIALFELVAQDKALYRRLMNSAMGMVIQQRVRGYIVDHVSSVLAGTMRFAEQPIGLIANHFAACTIGYIGWWLMADDASHYTARQVALLSQSLAVGGIVSLIGQPSTFKMPSEVGPLLA